MSPCLGHLYHFIHHKDIVSSHITRRLRTLQDDTLKYIFIQLLLHYIVTIVLFYCQFLLISCCASFTN
jgi:hypothetical protein